MEHWNDLIPEASQIRIHVEKNSEYQMKIKKNIDSLNKRIQSAMEKGETYIGFSVENEVEHEIRTLYLAKGYTFKPTGYIASVWQRTEDICW